MSGATPYSEILSVLTANATELIASQSVLLAHKQDKPIGCVCVSLVPPEIWDNRITGTIYALWVDGMHRDGRCAMVLGNAAFVMLKGMGASVIRVGADDALDLARTYKQAGFAHAKTIHVLEVQ